MAEPLRCPWCERSELERAYHDEEWGVPRFGDGEIFEFLTLESAQAGLSWLTILKKRENYRQAFAGFDPLAVAAFTQTEVDRLMQNPGIVRNRKKIEAAVRNARRFCELAAKHGSFSRWIWGFVDGRPLVNYWERQEQLPVSTPLSEKISNEMKRLGFSFLGPTVIYAHMQASGMVNDHLVHCFRHSQVQG